MYSALARISIGPALAALLLLAASASEVNAQNQGLVVRDRSLGAAPAGVVPPGTDPLGQHADYLIPGELGEQRGGNLFHSFDRFGIGAGETATFTDQGLPAGAPVVENVTGNGDVLCAAYSLTEGLQDLEASYELPITARDTRVRLFYSMSNAEVVEEPFNEIDVE